MRLDDCARGPIYCARMGKSASKKKSAAALAAGDEESARGRLLSAATHLFCKNGINATGIDAIINEAGTAKTTLYKLFGSKTNLVQRRAGERRQGVARMVHRRDGSRRRRRADETDADLPGAEALVWRGTLLRLPLHQRGRRARQGRTSSSATSRCATRRWCWRTSKSSPAKWARPSRQLLAHQLALLIDGAIVAAMVSRDPGARPQASAGICSGLRMKADSARRCAAGSSVRARSQGGQERS